MHVLSSNIAGATPLASRTRSHRRASTTVPRAQLHTSSQHVQQSSEEGVAMGMSRRDLLTLVALSGSAMLAAPQPASAIQGLTAGRIPGVSNEADENGFFKYIRPEGKSGGHGVGWSEIPRYEFKVPAGWEEIPVSIADLGGTEIDLRFRSKDQGDLAVVVAPVLRFADVGFNAQVSLELLGEPTKIIKGFAPELFGKPVDDEDIYETKVLKKGDITYYEWRTKPYNLVSATALRNRVFILTLSSSARQFKKHEADLRVIQESFFVPPA